ncbi:glycosyltransferase family 2 protein [Roseateles sp. GG27B]
MLSILVPTYNRAHLMRETVAHALASMSSHDELIIRDNASTDGSPTLLHQMAGDDVRIRLELANENIGPVLNWRECLRLARGTHIKLLFSDDLIFPEVFKAFYHDYLDGGYRVAFSSAKIGTGVLDAVPEFVLQDVERSLSAACFTRFTLTQLGKVPVSPSAFIFEKTLLEECFDEAMTMLVDIPEALTTGAGIDLLIVTLAVERAGNAFYSQRPHVFFRQHADSISTEKARLVKHLYNVSRVRLAASRVHALAGVPLTLAYAWADLLNDVRKSLQRLRAA